MNLLSERYLNKKIQSSTGRTSTASATSNSVTTSAPVSAPVAASTTVRHSPVKTVLQSTPNRNPSHSPVRFEFTQQALPVYPFASIEDFRKSEFYRNLKNGLSSNRMKVAQLLNNPNRRSISPSISESQLSVLIDNEESKFLIRSDDTPLTLITRIFGKPSPSPGYFLIERTGSRLNQEISISNQIKSNDRLVYCN
jgi:hypothetical protein